MLTKNIAEMTEKINAHAAEIERQRDSILRLMREPV